MFNLLIDIAERMGRDVKIVQVKRLNDAAEKCKIMQNHCKIVGTCPHCSRRGKFNKKIRSSASQPMQINGFYTFLADSVELVA